MTSPSPPLLKNKEPEAHRLPAPPRAETGPREHRTTNEPQVIKWSRGEKWLLAAGVASGVGVGTLGLASSYRALEKKAAASAAQGGWGWGEYAWMLPVGVDLGILTFSIVNLLLVKAEKPLAWVKWVPRALTIVTIVLNWSTGATLQGKLGHAALAALWVVLSEIAAHLYAAHIGRLKGRRQMERIRFSRWLYQPVSSFRVNRLMKSWEITSYEEALERDRELMVYRSQLRSDYGRWWRFKAPEDKLQPLRLAAYGMSIEQALEEPDRQEAAKDLREQKRDLQRAQARLQRIEAESQTKAAELQAEAAEVRAKGELEAAKAEAEAAASVAVQQAEADLQVRRAKAEAESRRLAAEADAESLRLQAEADASVKELEEKERARQAERVRQQEKDQFTWESERSRLLAQQQEEEHRRSLEAREREAEARQQQAEEQLKESAEAARARRIKKEEDTRAAEAEKKAAEDRRLAAEADLKAKNDRLKAAQAESDTKARERKAAEDEAAAEAARLKAAEDALKAAELEAEARLTPAEREARKVAEMIRTEGLKAVTLTRIEQIFGVSAGTASGRRKRAIQILQENGELPAEAA